MIPEFRRLERIRKQIPLSLRGKFSIEDDAAILAAGGNQWLLTTDVLVDGIDFHIRAPNQTYLSFPRRRESKGWIPRSSRRMTVLNQAKPEWIGRKALAVNLSDIAAMGGQPRACVVTLGIPTSMTVKWIERFYQGLVQLAKKYKTNCVGGDLSKSRTFFAGITLLGTVQKNAYVLRSGAKAGDWIGVTGKLGGSILGRHFYFEPRIREGQFLAKTARPTAMIDLSDGLVQDLGHVLEQSKVGAEIDLDQIPVSKEAFGLARRKKTAALRHALTDGEDFELLFTIPPVRKRNLERNWKKKFPKIPLSWIGRIQGKSGSIFWTKKGQPVPSPVGRKKGYDHFG